MFIDMAEDLSISVVTVICSGGLVYQKVFVNAREDARAAAKAFELAHAEFLKLFGWIINVKDY